MKIKILLFFILLTSFLFRFYEVSDNPPGLYWDEVVMGYDSYSILKTGKDHNNNTLPLFFESFGDWKLPVYHYLLVPSISIFQLNEFSVRLPSVFLGAVTPLIFFLLIKELTKSNSISTLGAFLLSVSPWHIQFARGAFEANVGLFVVLCATLLFLNGLREKRFFVFAFSFFLFVLSMYTYHAYRIFTPLLLLALVIIHTKEARQNLSKFLIIIIISIIISVPLLNFSLSEEGRVRATKQSIINYEQWNTARNDYNQKSKKPLRFLSTYVYYQPFYYSSKLIQGYFDHFSPSFLFFRGDQTGRHSQVDMGMLFQIELLTIIFGIYAFRAINKRSKKIILSFLFLAPIPAIIIAHTPHSLRTLQMAPFLTFFSALGIYSISTNKRLKPFKFIAIVIFATNIFTFSHLLFIHYPKKFARDWQDGNRQMVKIIEDNQHLYEHIFITNANTLPYIYVLFYQKYDPEVFQRDGSANSFGKYTFVNNDFNIYNKGLALYVAPQWEKVDGRLVSEVRDSSGELVYSIWEINENN